MSNEKKPVKKGKHVGVRGGDINTRILRGLDRMAEAQDRQSKAFEKIAKAALIYAESRSASSPKELAKFVEVLKAKGFELLDAMKPKAYQETPEDKAQRERQAKLHAKRQAILRAAWEKSEKPNHGPECEYDACVCPLYFADSNRAHFAGLGLPTALAYPSPRYEVNS